MHTLGLAHTQFAEATCGIIRLKPLDIGAQVRISVRLIKIAIACRLLLSGRIRDRLRPARETCRGPARDSPVPLQSKGTGLYAIGTKNCVHKCEARHIQI